jgi:hypothetical protein
MNNRVFKYKCFSHSPHRKTRNIRQEFATHDPKLFAHFAVSRIRRFSFNFPRESRETKETLSLYPSAKFPNYFLPQASENPEITNYVRRECAHTKPLPPPTPPTSREKKIFKNRIGEKPRCEFSIYFSKVFLSSK